MRCNGALGSAAVVTTSLSRVVHGSALCAQGGDEQAGWRGEEEQQQRRAKSRAHVTLPYMHCNTVARGGGSEEQAVSGWALVAVEVRLSFHLRLSVAVSQPNLKRDALAWCGARHG